MVIPFCDRLIIEVIFDIPDFNPGVIFQIPGGRVSPADQVGIKGIDWDDADEGTFGMDGVTPAKYKYLAYTVSASNAENHKWGWTMRLLEPNWKNLFQVVGDMYDAANYEAFLYQYRAQVWACRPCTSTHRS